MTPALRCPLAISWVVREGKRQLIVLAVKPDSAYEKIGVKAGDRLIQIDDTGEDRLTIQNVRGMLNSLKGLRLVVEREGKCMLFHVHGREQSASHP